MLFCFFIDLPRNGPILSYIRRKHMINIMEIKKLSREEKIQVMETIWNELTNGERPAESPAWHKNVLEETERRLQAGQEKVLDWNEAKQDLRNRVT